MRRWGGFIALTVMANAACLGWLATGVFMRAMRGCGSLVGESRAACEGANGGTPASVVLVVWVIADLILIGIAFAIHRRDRRSGAAAIHADATQTSAGGDAGHAVLE